MVAEKLTEAGITTSSELEHMAKSIESKLFLSNEDKQFIQLYMEKRKEKASIFRTATDEIRYTQSIWKDISSGCKEMDRLIGGGLKCGTITEVCGRGATGKTQLCMLMCASVQRHNNLYTQSKALYIDTENTFNASRQKELVDCIRNPYCSLSNIYVYKPVDMSSLTHLLNDLPFILQTHPEIRLIVIDSIAYLMREMLDMIKRFEILTVLVNSISLLTSSYHIASLITNHITSFSSEGSESILNPQSIIQPLLGPTWWHAVTNQLLMARNPHGARLLSVKKSPYLECATITFIINNSGVTTEQQ